MEAHSREANIFHNPLCGRHIGFDMYAKSSDETLISFFFLFTENKIWHFI